MKDSITSLCYVSKRSANTVELCRIADYKDGCFWPYYYDKSIPFNDTERDLLYGASNTILDDIYFIGVYEWSAYQDEGSSYRTIVKRSATPWIEVVHMSKCASIQNVIAILKSGWKYNGTYDKRHDIIICCAEEETATPAIYLPKESLKLVGEILYYSDSTFFVDVGTIDLKQSTGSCRCRYSRDDSRRYLINNGAWKKTGQLPVKAIEETLDIIVGDQINSLEKDVLPRRDRQAAKAALKKLSIPTIEQKIAEVLNCNTEQARKYVADYIKTREDLLTHDRIAALVEVLIESDSNAVAEMRQIIESHWQSDNADRLFAVQRDIAAENKVLQQIKDDQIIAKNELASLEEKKNRAEAQTEEAMRMQSDVEAEINRRLEEVRTNTAATLVNDAFIGAMVNRQIESMGISASSHGADSVSVVAPKGYSILIKESELPVTGTISENFGDLADSLEHYCVPEFSHQGLLLYLFASFACHQHLVFTGETGEALAVAYASAISGVQCPIISISGTADVKNIVIELEQLPHTIIAVHELDHAGYEVLRQLMRMFPDTQFLLLVDHEESLLMEPTSFFTTFAPVLTDVFCQSSEITAATGYECMQELMNEKPPKVITKGLLAERSKYHKWFGEDFITPLLENRCARIRIVMRRLAGQVEMTDRDAEAAAIMYLYVPILKCLQRLDKLSERIKAHTELSNETKAALISFCRIGEE